MRKTGSIWRKGGRARAQVVRRVCEVLEKIYGRPWLGNPEDPLDDLIYIITSNKTTPSLARTTYHRLKTAFGSWGALVVSSDSVLTTLMRPAGLGSVKSKQIKAALTQICCDFGSCDLTRLRELPNKEVQDYLVSLPGVSEKVAKCVMLFTMGAEVLPVDAHVHRITKRLGWTERKRADQCHAELEALIPAKRRHSFHVDCIVHGRAVCRPRNPSCAKCCIRYYCQNSRG